MLVGVLALAALGCLLAGLFAGELLLTYIAVGLAVCAGLLLIGTILVERRETQPAGEPTGGDAPAARLEPPDARDETAATVEREDTTRSPATTAEPPASTAGTAGTAEPEAATSPPDAPPATPEAATGSVTTSAQPAPASTDTAAPPEAEASGGETMVHVVRGRMRYHRSGCTLLADREHDEITVEDAHDEGFSPCTRCLGA